MSENNNIINITNTNVVNVPRQSRGAGTVLMFLFFWPALIMWWQILAVLWVPWVLICAIVAIWDSEFFADYWYWPWPAWLFGIR